MKEYKLKINGEIDFIIISPQVLSSVITQIHNSPKREVAVNIEDIMPPGFTEYLLRVINSNRFTNERFRYRYILNSVYTRSGQNSTPNSNATNLHSSQKRCCSFCISSSNASPTFQVQKSIFHQMTKPIQVTVILPLLLAISFSRNDDIHSSISGISNDLIGVIPTIGQ